MAKASIQAVAAEAGVSASTVSRTFAKPDLVLPETRDRVLAAAQKLDFQVSRSAAALKSGQSFRIAFLHADTIDVWFNVNVYRGLDSVFHPAGYDISVYSMSNAQDRHRFFTDLPVRRNADAVIVCSFDIDPDEVSRLKDMNVPLIGINTPSIAGLDGAVCIDDLQGMHMALEHLTSLGHRRIAYVYTTSDDAARLRFSAENRLQGLLLAAKAHPDVTIEQIRCSGHEDPTSTALAQLTTMTPAPTAVCFQTDELALPVLYRLPQYGLQVPRDLSVIGFDDIPFASKMGLTTLRQRPQDLGAIAARKAIEAMGGPLPEPRFETVRAQLMLRDTTAIAA
ncbi:LacI family DNA-binding transcriptional regulator [Bifidobacterium aerophilum]|uniref:LacI family DNA-binding transcriptional regulator n=1 Tax=Bifidobacterium aerophilum TaxID=1798155 RepID=A0A6N9Z7H1_9BIFI|nr:LacI family DNA-binding transcriptional regulator [Bifidobacterium aerophilum]NEG90340.1 LacI family DNA-binding transcriptional regulator [Bifidobacterium aerophilum]